MLKFYLYKLMLYWVVTRGTIKIFHMKDLKDILFTLNHLTIEKFPCQSLKRLTVCVKSSDSIVFFLGLSLIVN